MAAAAADDAPTSGRSILSFRREQVHPMDAAHGDDPDLAAFQGHVAHLFHDLAAEAAAGGLGVDWIRKLLDSFLICQEEFRAILFNHSSLLARHPIDRLLSDFSERAVRSLDVLNAVRDGIDQIRRWQKHVEIVLAALDPRLGPIGQGQLRRARKSLTDLTLLMLDEKSASTTGGALQNNRSFGRVGPVGRRDSSSHRHFRSLSWSLSRSWSAARQLQAIGNNLSAPRGNDVQATHGLVNPIYTMSSVMLFVMWVLVAAIPCQDRGLQIHFSAPRSFPWMGPVMSMYERILEESRRKERKHSVGLLGEIHRIERCSSQLMELIDVNQFELSEEKEGEVRLVVQELGVVYDGLKEGLDPLERQVREVFQRVVRNRTDGLWSFSGMKLASGF